MRWSFTLSLFSRKWNAFVPSNKRPTPRAFLQILLAGLAAATGLHAEPGAATDRLPEPLVYLADIDPTILQDIRYASPNNFTGAKVPGYNAAECILTRPAAEALRRAQSDLAVKGLTLKVYDCYRPKRAVASFMAWARRGGANDTDPSFFPNVKRRSLVETGYISAQSGHSTGAAVDLTLVRLDPNQDARKAAPAVKGDAGAAILEKKPGAGEEGGAENVGAPSPAKEATAAAPHAAAGLEAGGKPSPALKALPGGTPVQPPEIAASSELKGACTEEATQRRYDESLDMGTGYDCFDPKSHTHTPQVSQDQARHRAILVSVMGRNGFKNYKKEWWHFSHPSGGSSFDIPIGPRPDSDMLSAP